jgi:hypothetical protein
MRFTKQILSSNDVTFQVANAHGHKIWVPRAMVTVVEETPSSITFDAPEKLAYQIKLALEPDDRGPGQRADGTTTGRTQSLTPNQANTPKPVFNSRTDQLFTPPTQDGAWKTPPTVTRTPPSGSDPGATPRPGDPGALPRPTRDAPTTPAQGQFAGGWRPTAQYKPAPQQLPFQPEALVRPKAVITEGRYTVVFNGDVTDYVTLRISKWESRPDALIFSFLRGPDNSTDYTPFSELNLKTLRYRVWNNFRHEGFKRMVEAAMMLLDMTEDEQYDAGETYALKSSNCCKCGRDLTRAISIKRGMGADCWSKYAPLSELRKMVEEQGRKVRSGKTTVIVTDQAGSRAVTLDELGGEK